MADSTVSALAVFDKGNELHYLEKNGEILFPAEEIGRHLGYAEPAISINNLYNRNANELKLYSSIINLINEEGFQRDTRVFTEEGVYILSMLARTNEAKKFRARVALLLRRLRHEALCRELDRARAVALEQGRAEALDEGRREGRSEGAKAALSLTEFGKKQLTNIVRYHKLGLSNKEVGKLLDIADKYVTDRLWLARRLGLLPPARLSARQRETLQKGRAANSAKGARP